MVFAEKSILDFGAKGDGQSDDCPAFQKALDSGERYLYVPVGKYVIRGTLVIHSDTSLRLHPEAVLFWADGSGTDAFSHLITNEKNADNITIDGGIWDGNAEGNPRIPALENEVTYLGVAIEFRDMEGLSLKNMTLRNSDSFHLRINYVKDFRIENITFDDQVFRANQDGIHIAGGCENGIIRHIRGVGVSSPNDDMIAMISDFSFHQMSPEDPARGQKHGPIKNIFIEDVSADNTFSFLRIMSEKECIENISVNHVRGGCYYLGIQMQISPYLRGTAQADQLYGTGKIKNVTISDWHIWHRHPYGMNVDWQRRAEAAVNGLIDIEESAENLVIDRFVRECTHDNLPKLPTLYLNNRQKNKIKMIGGTNTECLTGTDRYSGNFILQEITEPSAKTVLYGDIPYFRLG